MKNVYNVVCRALFLKRILYTVHFTILWRAIICDHPCHSNQHCQLLLSHPGIPGVTWCFCTGSYATAATAGCRFFWITFEQLFGFLSFLAQLLALNSINYLIRFWSIFLWPWPRFFKVNYVICYILAKNGPIATKRKANILIEL